MLCGSKFRNEMEFCLLTFKEGVMFGLDTILSAVGAWCAVLMFSNPKCTFHCAQELRLLQECAITHGR